MYGSHAVGATTAALIANVVATVPSYLMSRYWIWKDAKRTQVGRQVVLYWATSAASILLTSLATGAIAHHIPESHRFHLALVGVAFFFVNVAFWFGKFVVYHKFIFPTDRTAKEVVVDASLYPPTSASRAGGHFCGVGAAAGKADSRWAVRPVGRCGRWVGAAGGSVRPVGGARRINQGDRPTS